MIQEYLNLMFYYYLCHVYESFGHIEMIADYSTGEIVSIHMAKDTETFNKSIKQLKKEI